MMNIANFAYILSVMLWAYAIKCLISFPLKHDKNIPTRIWSWYYLDGGVNMHDDMPVGCIKGEDKSKY